MPQATSASTTRALAPQLENPAKFQSTLAAANDHFDPSIDPWRLLIDGFKRIGQPRMAILVAEAKLEGHDFDVWTRELLQGLEARRAR